jgi:hypothetical protein
MMVRDKMRTALILYGALFMMVKAGTVSAEQMKVPEESMELTSPSFEQGKPIPKKFTCDGGDVSPALHWTNPPSATTSYALIADDPDAPGKTWVHWVVFNIPGDKTELGKSFPKEDRLDDGTIQGTNDFGTNEYGGPCPPSGTHRYFFRLYALDTMLSLYPGTPKDKVMKAMEGHVLAEAELMGTYTHRP